MFAPSPLSLPANLLLPACAIAAVAILALAYSAGRIAHRHPLSRRLAKQRRKRIVELLRLIRMAEEIAQLGLWQYYISEDRQVWSGGLKKLFGLEPDEEMMAGDAATLLAALDVNLVSEVMNRRDQRGPFRFRFAVQHIDGNENILEMQACHLNNQQRVVGVVIDVTDVAELENRMRRRNEIALREIEHARELAETDPLTGLANRRCAMGELDRLVLRARSNEEPLSLIVFDIDHFKQVNDNFGHPVGDAAIRQIAQIANEQAREGDLVGRIGGEEFVWVVPGADAHFAHLVAERLRLAISLGGAPEAVPSITVSIGIATIKSDDTGLSLFARADAALYDAKGAGRNRVRLAA